MTINLIHVKRTSSNDPVPTLIPGELVGKVAVAQGELYMGLDGGGNIRIGGDVRAYANLAAFPVTGEAGKIYLDITTSSLYQWTGSYVILGSGGSLKYVDLIGDGFLQTFVVNHGLNTRALTVGIARAIAPFNILSNVQIEFTTLNSLTITLSIPAPALSEYEVTVLG